MPVRSGVSFDGTGQLRSAELKSKLQGLPLADGCEQHCALGTFETYQSGLMMSVMPWINALAELRQRATREGYCYQHVQAITVAIDQYAEKALGNRDYFLNKPYGVG